MQHVSQDADNRINETKMQLETQVKSFNGWVAYYGLIIIIRLIDI